MSDTYLSKQVRILIASPSDVAAERDIAKQVIHDMKIICKDDLHLELDPRRWETDVPALMGKPAQDIVNEWLVDESSCAVCIFWKRIGSPTDNAVSGTVEELERMLKAGKPVLLYFSDAEFSMSATDRKQLNSLEDWKEKIWEENLGLPKSYTNIHEFENLLRSDLEKLLKNEFCDGSKRVVVEPTLPVFSELDRRYRATLKEELHKISLLGSPDIQNVQVGLNDTFVPLRISHTWRIDDRFKRKKHADVRRDEMKPHSPDELMRRVFPAWRLLLVIGDPGAGKTTLLKYYALSCLQDKTDLLFGEVGPVRVFYLPFRELKRGDNKLYRPLPDQLSLWASARANTIEPSVFDEWLHNVGGTKSLVLLDGLDEISDIKLRKSACQWIDHQYAGFPESCFVVTSRLTGYRKTEAVELEVDHFRADVMDFTQEQQEEFLLKWFMAAYCRELRPVDVPPDEWSVKQKEEAEVRTRTIVEYLTKPENRGLRELAAVPLMLQIMAILWKEREFLPGNRVKLYSAALDYLLEYRDELRKIPPLLSADKARMVLAPIALWMQEDLETDEVERSAMHSEMQKVLSTLDHPPSAEEFCKNLTDRAGLLVEYGELRKEYLFRHKTFREYLAGGHLTDKIKRNSSLMALLVKHFGEDWWSETLTFFMGQADAKMFDLFMETFFKSQISDELSPKQQSLLQVIINEAPQKTTSALCENLLSQNTTDNRQRYILDCLKTLGKVSAIDTVSTFILQKLAHNREIERKAEEVFDLLVEPNIGGWKNIAGRNAVKGLSESFSNLYENGAQYIRFRGGRYICSPTKKVVKVSDFHMAKYPVTNRQYRLFINYLDGKPSVNTKFLSKKIYIQSLLELAGSGDKALKGFEEYLKKEPDLVRRFRSRFDDDRKFNRDDQPVVGVSWYDAQAYCLWLSLLSDMEYRLPTEQEWEWAAGGRRGFPNKILSVKKYPWGDKPEPTPKHANYGNNEGSTTLVGRYPEGATQEGVYEMAGNVWEWIENWFEDGTDFKVLCGGSWNYDMKNLLCQARDINFPESGDVNIGFRVICNL